MACTTAAANALGLPWNLTNIPALNLDTSFNISLESKCVLVARSAAAAPSRILSVYSPIPCPAAIENLANLPASSADNPLNSVKREKSSTCFPLNLTAIPNWLDNSD